MANPAQNGFFRQATKPTKMWVDTVNGALQKLLTAGITLMQSSVLTSL